MMQYNYFFSTYMYSKIFNLNFPLTTDQIRILEEDLESEHYTHR